MPTPTYEVPFVEDEGVFANLKHCRFEERPSHQQILIRATNQFVDSFLHWHDFIQVWYVMDGVFEHNFQQHTEIIEAGRVVIVPPFCIHSVNDHLDKPFYVACFEFSMEMLEILLDDSTFRTAFLRPMEYPGGRSSFALREPFRHSAEELMGKLIRAYSDNPNKCLALYRDEIAQLFQLIGQQAIDLSTTAADVASWRSFKIIRRAIGYLMDHYQEDIQIEDLCKYCQMSRSHFSRMFKEVTGNTYSQCLSMIRVTIARYYVANTDMPIAEVMKKSGLKNRANFYRKFHYYSGSTPQEVRNSYRQKRGY